MEPQKFCAGCQRFRNTEDLHKVLRGRVTRLMCKYCIARKNESMYASKNKRESYAEASKITS